VAWEIIEVPAANRLLAPVLLTVPLQLLAYHIAVYRGTGVDQRRNLAKSVTVEWRPRFYIHNPADAGRPADS